MSCAQFFAVTARHRFVAAGKLRAIVIIAQQTGTTVVASPKSARQAQAFTALR